MRRAGLRHREMRLGLGGVHQVRKLHRVLDEEDRDVVADQIPVAFVGVELHGEAADVARGVGRARARRARSRSGRRPASACRLRRTATRACTRSSGLRALEVPVRRRAARVDDALGNPFVVEVRDLLAKDEVLEQRRSAQAGLERVLIVANRHALIGRQARSVESTRTDRAVRRLVLADDGSAAADLLRSVHFADGAGSDNRVARLDRCAFGRRQRCLGIVLSGLGGIERKGRGHFLRRDRLLRSDIAVCRGVGLRRAADRRPTVANRCSCAWNSLLAASVSGPSRDATISPCVSIKGGQRSTCRRALHPV